jgi:type VI secretion system Hcp family effector
MAVIAVNPGARMMMTRRVQLVAVAAWVGLLTLGLSAGTAWADAAFARITGATQRFIVGDQVDIKITGSKDAIPVTSTQFEVENPAGTFPGQVTTPVAGPVVIVKRFDRATPKLMQAAFTGEQLTVEIVRWMLDGAGVSRPTTRVRLDGARITSLGAAASLNGSNASAQEQVAFIYRTFTLTVPVLDVKGVTISTVTVCLDVERGSPC